MAELLSVKRAVHMFNDKVRIFKSMNVLVKNAIGTSDMLPPSPYGTWLDY